MTPVTDQDILAQLDARQPKAVSDPALLAQLEGGPSAIADVAKQTGAGIISGTAQLAAAPHSLSDLVMQGTDWLAEKVLPKDAADRWKRAGEEIKKYEKTSIPRPSAVADMISEAMPKPGTAPGQYARTASELVPGALTFGPGGPIGNVAKYAVAPGVASEFVGQKVRDSQFKEYEPVARIATALMTPTAVNTAMRAATLTPFPARPEKIAAANILENAGVPLTAGQKTGNRPLRYAESSLGNAPMAGSKAQLIEEEQGRKFTQAAMKSTGATDDLVNPETLRKQQTALGSQFENLASRNTLVYDQQLVTDLRGAANEYGKVLNALQKDVVANIINDISQYGTAMPGDVYQKARSMLSKMATAKKNTEPELSNTFRSIRKALDEAMDRSIAPSDRASWKNVREEYAAFKTIEAASKASGEKTALGEIVPSALRREAEKRGNVPKLAELGRAGVGTMTPMPQSGTGDRTLINAIMATLGAGAGQTLAGGPGMAAGVLTGVLAPGLAGRGLMSGPVQALLGNQTLPRDALVDPKRNAIIQLLMGAR